MRPHTPLVHAATPPRKHRIRQRAALVVWASSLWALAVACDLPTGSRAGPVGDACDPLEPAAERGCEAGFKCGFVTLLDDGSGVDGATRCVPDGHVPDGGRCGFGDPGSATGFDNCRSGLACRAGRCAPICGMDPDTCAPGAATCRRYDQLFTDDPAGGVGVCEPLCDPLTPGTCGSGRSCYVDITDGGTASCAVVAGDRQQGQVCRFLNECGVVDADRDGVAEHSLSCTQALPGDPLNLYCATTCDATSDGADAACAAVPALASGQPRCVPMADYFEAGAVTLPRAIGMCIDCANPALAALPVCGPR